MEINIIPFVASLSSKGNLENNYKPFLNFQINTNIYSVTYNGLKYFIPENKAINPKNGEILEKIEEVWVDKHGVIVTNVIPYNYSGSELKITKGSLIGLDTELLNFDLNHPVDILILPSYDGSVNLILNDDKNPPRLINSRFSVREKDTYEIVDRIGENDTNIYEESSFDKETSLYYLYNLNPIIDFKGYISGNLLVGLYCFYITYCDADDNESDFTAESKLIPVFIGDNGDIYSMDGGIKNQNSYKGLLFIILNLDRSYNYLKIYYIRYFADYLLNRVVECKKIYLKFPIKSDLVIIQITGNEEAEDLDPNMVNVSYFNPKSVLTLALCRNILFFGNIVQNTDNYRELLDCALRIYPYLQYKEKEFPSTEINNSNTYQNTLNEVGYFNKEYYRFGVVFIYKNGTLSNVYNTLGLELNNNDDLDPITLSFIEDLSRKYLTVNDNGWISTSNYSSLFNYVNAKGVCYINDTNPTKNRVYGINFNIPDEVKNYLEKVLGVRGYFFVRQKCIPKLLAQCYIMEMDEVLEAPIINYQGGRIAETFISLVGERTITNNYTQRLHTLSKVPENKAFAGICPDFLLNLPYYNLIFNGNDFILEEVTENSDLILQSNIRFYKMNPNYTLSSSNKKYTVKINTVTEDVPSIAIQDKVYKLKMGEAEEAYRYKFVEEERTNSTNPNIYESRNLVRGIYSPYLAIYSDTSLEIGKLYNIYLKSNNSSKDEYQTRMDSFEPYYAISDRYQLSENSKTCWRGDCYLNTFTFRLNRNFNDSTLPNNDTIIHPGTWEDNYTSSTENWTNIFRSDINAVLMGSWITIYVRSAINYALRSVDHSHTSEEALMGAPRSFYPKIQMGWLGDYKSPDSYLYNDAYRASVGYKCYFALNNPNYIKNSFSNRIQYSAIAILDSFKNNYRYSLSTYYRDYSAEYGGIMKLIGFEGYLLVVFEHGIGLAPINERVLMSNENQPVYLNTNNVLPEELNIITDTYGSLWPESVIKSESGMVYGVDTIAKKIWRIKGLQIEILSDLKVNSFLSKNITLGEQEKYPTIGLRNVKTHYNNNKKDIIFTFYDDVYKDEEKVWSLCYNEILGLFITFYSWIPSYSENIDTQFFTFNREQSKIAALINKCNYNILGNTGIVADWYIDDNKIKFVLHYIEYVKDEVETAEGWTTLEERIVERNPVTFDIEHDHWLNYKKVEKQTNNIYSWNPTNGEKYLLLEISADGKVESIAIPNLKILLDFKTYLYAHGKTKFASDELLKPTYWYDELHPFEFEFVVTDKIGQLKIFENLQIISNKAEPESFHFEVEGDNYEFSADKRAMYIRLEATKELYQNMGSNILFDRKYKEAVNGADDTYRGGIDYNYNRGNAYPQYSDELQQQVKSSIFPLYYSRIDTFDNIYHCYREMLGKGYDFKNLSGSEILWDLDLNQFNIVTHIKNSPMDKYGTLRGNSLYKEGKWNVLIPSIVFNLKNEPTWPLIDGLYLPPIVIKDVPQDIETYNITGEYLPNTYHSKTNIYQDIRDYIDTTAWTYRKEAKIRDKWIKIRVRYNGKNIAIIHSILTLYNFSYA